MHLVHVNVIRLVSCCILLSSPVWDNATVAPYQAKRLLSGMSPSMRFLLLVMMVNRKSELTREDTDCLRRIIIK